MVLTYVPEADEMWFSDALKLAYERDEIANDNHRGTLLGKEIIP